MTTLNERLRDADPMNREPELSDDDRERIWRAMLAEPQQGRPVPWAGSVALASAVAVTIAILVGRDTFDAGPSTSSMGAVKPGDAPRERRQLQFATPGGTRVIWVFDSTFDLK